MRIKKELHKLVAIGSIVLAIFIVMQLYNAQTNAAENGSSIPGNTISGDRGCVAPGSNYNFFADACFGASWRKYPVSSDAEVIPDYTYTYAGQHEVYVGLKGSTLEGCLSVGANEYYLLTLEKFSPRDYKSLGMHAGGILSVSSISNKTGGSGGVNFYSDPDSGAEEWGTVLSDFQTAQSHNGTDTTWENTGAFCWNDAWKDPDPKPPVTGSGDGEFFSRSSVTVPQQGSDIDRRTVRTNWDGEATYKFSTDEEYVTLEFSHEMKYDVDLKPFGHVPSQDYHCSGNVTPTTRLDVKNTSASSSGSITAGCLSQGATLVSKHTEKVHLNPGETKTIYQAISYADKFTTATASTPDCSHCAKWYKGDCVRYHKGGKHTISGGGGSGGSKVVVVITRPEEPTETETERPWVKDTGSTNTGPLFAGQSSNIGWNASAEAYPTRRILGWDAIGYIIKSDQTISESQIKGTVVRNDDPKNHDVTSSPSIYFRPYELGAESFFSSNETRESAVSVHETAHIAVPNLVGHKYCAAFGFHYQYWYYIQGNDNGENGWKSGKTYWNHYDAACRTIAKKPTVAFWNSSLFASGNVITSSAERFVDHLNLFPYLADAAGARTTFGSWAENLAIVGKDITGFTSGAVLSRGFSRQQLSVGKNSKPLTISNAGSTNGQSQVGGNSAFYTRLVQYLTLKANTPVGDLNNLNTSNISGTKIIHVGGDLSITNDIILPKNYNNIYEIPQVVLIVDGNVNVHPDVKQIDAWIIAPSGKLDTCSGYVASKGNPGGTDTKTTHTGWGLCDKQLTFNGPVMVGSIVLNRTGGADPMISDGQQASEPDRQRYTPAEVFNLSAEVYLWSYAQAGRYGSSYSEAYSRELPPRY